MPSKQLKDSTVALAVAVPLVLPARNLRSTSVAKSDDCCKGQFFISDPETQSFTKVLINHPIRSSTIHSI